MTFKARMRRLAERVNALSLRERALLLLAVFAVIFVLWDMTAMQPVSDRQELVKQQLETVRERVSALTTGIQRLATERARDPNAELEARRAVLENEIREMHQLLDTAHGGIAAPRQSIAVLAGLLGEQAGVSIVELENLPVQSLLGQTGRPVPGIFVHRVRIVIETDFDGVGSYLGRVNNLPPGVFWESMELTVPGWPVNRVELVLYSLTFDDNWLGV